MALGYFTAQRLLYINETVSKLRPNITNLISSGTDPFPLNKNLTDFQKDIENLNRKVYFFRVIFLRLQRESVVFKRDFFFSVAVGVVVRVRVGDEWRNND